MGETAIYKTDQEKLYRLLDQAVALDGATLLIPDLQRPFRWSPAQVTMLLDSLMRGWPFGTLLLWAMSDEKVGEIPAREFWRLVDRVKPDEGTPAVRRSPPTQSGFRMVLDGQQRLQSLVIALMGGDTGFKLPDWEWWESVDPDRAVSRSAKYWSKGVLCLDLNEYVAQRSVPKVLSRHVDYTKALTWVVCAASGGRSDSKPPPTYAHPIRMRLEHPGKFIPVSEFWSLAPVGDFESGALMEEIQKLLLRYAVPESRAAEVVSKMLDLVLALGKVKTTEVGFLQIQPHQGNGSSPEQYDDAVVNIFTRLNAGGSPLTEEEITFAWIKRNWKPGSPGVPAATPAFERLQQELRAEGLDLSMDKLVQAVSVIWAVLEREGKLLQPSDLLRGDRVGPLATGVSRRWSSLSESVVATAHLLRELGLNYRGQYDSLNAFITLAAWRCVGVDWLEGEKRPKPSTRLNVTSRLDSALRAHAARFLILTSWAGRWRVGAVKAFQDFAEALARDCADSRAGSDKELTDRLASRLVQWVKDCEPDALDHVKNLQAGRREDVRYYFVPLWVWHRLDLDRRYQSEGINIPSRAKPAIDVDHIVSFASWGRRLEDGQGEPTWENDINQLGNCFLLEKNFNVSKLDRPLGELLADIDRFKDPEALRGWRETMGLPAEMVDSGQQRAERLRELFGLRTELIKASLASFVRNEVGMEPDADPPVVHGEWSTSFVEKDKKSEATLRLSQDGLNVHGEYGENGRVSGRLTGRRLHGEWSEGDYQGGLAWEFDVEASTFTGTWGNGARSHSGGTWNGSRSVRVVEVKVTESPRDKASAGPA